MDWAALFPSASISVESFPIIPAFANRSRFITIIFCDYFYKYARTGFPPSWFKAKRQLWSAPETPDHKRCFSATLFFHSQRSVARRLGLWRGYWVSELAVNTTMQPRRRQGSGRPTPTDAVLFPLRKRSPTNPVTLGGLPDGVSESPPEVSRARCQ